MRNAFVDELVAQARVNPKIALIVGDLGYSVIEPFAEEFPDRFINAGVAEQNMTGLAAGMASEGYHVFTYSIANFPTFRCAEQIRNDVDYHRLPVTVVAVGGGLGYGALGYSHHAVQDYALLRSFPNMLIAAPGDPLEVRACLKYLIDHPGPSYLRLGKAGEPVFHDELPSIEAGKWVTVLPGESGQVILATGAALGYAVERHQKIQGPKPMVCSLPLWGMRFKQFQADQVQRFQAVTTMEDHLQDGGFGTWLIESCLGSQELVGRIAVEALDPKVCGMVGSQKILNQSGGLSA
jgi:transketolase